MIIEQWDHLLSRFSWYFISSNASHSSNQNNFRFAGFFRQINCLLLLLRKSFHQKILQRTSWTWSSWCQIGILEHWTYIQGQSSHSVFFNLAMRAPKWCCKFGYLGFNWPPDMDILLYDDTFQLTQPIWSQYH